MGESVKRKGEGNRRWGEKRGVNRGGGEYERGGEVIVGRGIRGEGREHLDRARGIGSTGGGDRGS